MAALGFKNVIKYMESRNMKSVILILFLTSWISPVIANDVCNCKGHAGVGGPCYAGVGGAQYDGVGGPQYKGAGGPKYDGVGGPAYDGVGGRVMPVWVALVIPVLVAEIVVQQCVNNEKNLTSSTSG
jgi:hypothetical protein